MPVARSAIATLADICLSCVLKNLQAATVGPKLKLLPPEISYQVFQSVSVQYWLDR